jgi:hypothetical protein
MKNKILAFTFLLSSFAFVEQALAQQAWCYCGEEKTNNTPGKSEKSCNQDNQTVVWFPAGNYLSLMQGQCLYDCHCDAGHTCNGGMGMTHAQNLAETKGKVGTCSK